MQKLYYENRFALDGILYKKECYQDVAIAYLENTNLVVISGSSE